jgi:predicted TIM-barrel fold metal-dependent hydrolase
MSHGVELIDDELEPVLDVAEATGAPLLVHPKLFNSLQPATDQDATEHEILTDRYRLNAIFGREAALAASIAKVIHTGLLDRHPDLNLVYHHLGGNIASMMGRIHLQLDAGRFPGQTDVVSISEFRSQLETRIYLDTAGFFGYQTPLRAALDTVPASQLVFGTDAPYEPRSAEELEQHWQSIPAATSMTTSEQILGGTALELLANTAN